MVRGSLFSPRSFTQQEDLKCLSLGRGHVVHLRAAVKKLQEENGGGPLSSDSGNVRAAGVDTLDGLLATLSLGGHHVPAAATTLAPKRGEALRIVDYISAAMVAEEEVSLGGGISIKLNSRPKLEKVSPAAWIVANARILTALRSRDPDFDVAAYTKYTEMVGSLAADFPGSLSSPSMMSIVSDRPQRNSAGARTRPIWRQWCYGRKTAPRCRKRKVAVAAVNDSGPSDQGARKCAFSLTGDRAPMVPGASLCTPVLPVARPTTAPGNIRQQQAASLQHRGQRFQLAHSFFVFVCLLTLFLIYKYSCMNVRMECLSLKYT